MQQESTHPIELYKISQFNEPYLYSVNRSTFEKNNTQNTFDGFFKDRLWQEDYLYIILGSDSGLLVNHIIEHGLAYGSRYIVIDLPNVLESIEAQLTFTEWDDKIALCSIDDWQTHAEKFKIQSYLFTDKVKYVKSIAVIDGFEPNYHALDSQISLALESIQHKTRVSLSRKPFMTRQIENLSENTTPVYALKKEFEGKTCIILGGGPSLDDNIDWIKKHKNNIIIICVSRIAKKLIQENITPHIMFSVDPHHVSFDVSKESLTFPDSVLFVHSNFVVPTLAGQWPGKSVFFGQKTPWAGKLNQGNFNLTGPTVTNSAVTAAVELGFKKILLTGVDLCFASDGRTHASGSNEIKIGPNLGIKGQWVETYNGKYAETSTSFLHASYVLSTQGKFAKDHNCELINLSANAAKIEHIAHIPQQDITFDQQDNVDEIINSIPTLSPQEAVRENKQLLLETEKLISELNQIETIAKKALLDNHALYKKYTNKEKNHQFTLKLDKAEKKLNSRLEFASTLVKTFGIQHFIKSVKTDTEEEWSEEKMEETGRIYYQSFTDSIKELKPLLIDASQRIKSRIEEEKSSPNIEVMLAQWQKDKHFARAYLWKKSHLNKYNKLSEQLKKQFDNLEQLHQEVIVNTDTGHFRRTQSQSSLNGVNRKIVRLFQQKNEFGLEKLISALEKMIGDKDEAQWLFNIATGYLASMRGDKAAALTAFEKVSDKHLTEDEGIQIASLALALFYPEKAEARLKQLSKLSDNYTPRYAEVLVINNKVSDAIASYITYLVNNQYDIKSWLALGKLYIKTGAVDSAKQAFNSILAFSDGNKEATHYLSQL